MKKLLWPLALLALVVINPTLQPKPGKDPEALKVARDLRKAIDSDRVSQVKLVGPLAGLMQEAQQGQDSDPPQAYEANPQDHVMAVPPSGTTSILHSTFPVSTYASFVIQVPPGMLHASLTGNVECFTVTTGHSRHLSNVVVSLMNEAEFRDLVQRNPASATYTTDPAPKQAIQWVLDSDFKQTKKYYLIFTNPAGNSRTRMVKATFSVHFY